MAVPSMAWPNRSVCLHQILLTSWGKARVHIMRTRLCRKELSPTYSDKTHLGSRPHYHAPHMAPGSHMSEVFGQPFQRPPLAPGSSQLNCPYIPDGKEVRYLCYLKPLSWGVAVGGWMLLHSKKIPEVTRADTFLNQA